MRAGHQINLSKMWQVTCAGAETKGLDFSNLGSLDGNAVASRRFNRPTGLEADTVVYLVIEKIDMEYEVSLNGNRLIGRADSVIWRCRVDQHLSASNEIQVCLEAAVENFGNGRIYLEIVDTATSLLEL